MDNVKPNQQRAKNAVTWTWVALALELALLLHTLLEYLFPAYADESTAFIIAGLITGAAYVIAIIVSFIAFIMWFSRAYHNLSQKAAPLSYSGGWATGCWFVPILNLYRPYKMMRELYEETKKLLDKQAGLYSGFAANIVNRWWGLWIASKAIAVFSARFSDQSPLGTAVNMLSSLIGIASFCLTVKVITTYSNIEPLLNETSGEVMNRD